MASTNFSEFMERTRRASERVRQLQDHVDAMHRDVEKSNRRLGEDLAEERRSGRQGRAWQVLQQRIDMNRTTERDVYSGVDKSPEAREVRAVMVKNNIMLQHASRDVGDEDNPLAQSRGRMEEALRRLRDLQPPR